MMMFGRAWEAGNSHRYGFNGQELENEVYNSGQTYSAEFWQYDTRLGRRWNVDPVVLPAVSSYSAFKLNPIYFADVTGLSATKPWELQVDAEGNTSYIATSENDDIHTFMSEYNVGFDEAVEIFSRNGLENFIPQTHVGNESFSYDVPCSTCDAKPVGIGISISAEYYALDWNNSSGQQKVNHFVQSLYLENLNSESEGLADMDKIFSARPEGVGNLKFTGHTEVNDILFSEVQVSLPRNDRAHGNGRYVNTRYIESQGQFEGSMYNNRVSFNLTNYYKDQSANMSIVTGTISVNNTQADDFYENVFWPK
ncbi:MAG: hypothetical protein H6546_00740 [Chitinophagales bacterium]|nr:hypothetical protein [Chitinophagales bacterium]